MAYPEQQSGPLYLFATVIGFEREDYANAFRVEFCSAG